MNILKGILEVTAVCLGAEVTIEGAKKLYKVFKRNYNGNLVAVTR